MAAYYAHFSYPFLFPFCFKITINRNNGNNSFISNPNRINVAISRAKEQFWLVSNKEYLSKIPIFKRLYYYKKGGHFLTNAYKYQNKKITPVFKLNKK